MPRVFLRHWDALGAANGTVISGLRILPSPRRGPRLPGPQNTAGCRDGAFQEPMKVKGGLVDGL